MIGYQGTDMNRKTNWTADEIAILTREWELGTPSRVIGELIGRNRNMVIGKAHRLKLTSPNARKTQPRESRRKQVRDYPKEYARAKELELHYAMVKNKGKRKPPMRIPKPSALPGQNPIGLMELNKMKCRAIVGEDNTIHRLAVYCGDEVFPGKSYCPTHYAMFTKDVKVA